MIGNTAVKAAIELAALLLRRSETSSSGYGYVQTWDAAQLGLVEGDMQQWTITERGRALLALSEDEQPPAEPQGSSSHGRLAQ